MSKFDVAIVGGGLIGASIAFELAAEKLRVVVVDRQKPGLEASWAAAGMLSPGPHAPEDEPLTPLAQESLRLYPKFVAAVEKAGGQSVSFQREGALEVFCGPHAETERDKLVASHRRLGLAAEGIPSEAARQMEPALGPGVSAAAWFPDEATVEPRLLMEAVLEGASQRGVEIRQNYAVTSLRYDQGREGARCIGIAAGENQIDAKFVVLAAGCFTGAIESSAGKFLPASSTHPVRGQMIALRPKSARLRRVLRSERGYLVPRRDGKIVAGSTTEDAGFEKQVTAEGMQSILSAALDLMPDLAGAEIVETWSGLRPGTMDGLPILGPAAIEGLLIATGHFRNGILLAPVTAKLICDWILRGRASLDVTKFSPMRFDASSARSSSTRSARSNS